MLETRIVTNEDMFGLIKTKQEDDMLEGILKQERTWADEANEQRRILEEKEKMQQKIFEILKIVIPIIGIIVSIVIIKKIIKYSKELKQIVKIEPDIKHEYYREFLDKKYTPGQIAFLHYFPSNDLQYNMSKIISATMLDLSIKKYISFEVSGKRKNEIKVHISENSNSNNLLADEKMIFEMLQKIPRNNSKEFTMKELKKYIEKNSKQTEQLFKNIEKSIKESEIKNGDYDKKLYEKSNKAYTNSILYVLWAVLGCITISITLTSIVAAIYCAKIGKAYGTLTKKGENEKQKLNGLKKYLLDFSTMKDKTVPELILWEEYLVYATIFGIANKVIEQLKVVYPQITDNNYMASNNYAFLSIMYMGNSNRNFITSLDSAVSSSLYSSGGGSGGGFSGGGGFGRRWRTEWAEDNTTHKKI